MNTDFKGGDASRIPDIHKEQNIDKTIALAGNPNVGKSTIFNNLTGLNQHTGNWPGKTVVHAQGKASYKNNDYTLIDLPGTYSLMANSAEEEVARDFITFGGADAVIVICDATCLERNLNLVLQTLEITDKVIVCVNLADEAKKKHIKVNTDALQELLGVPVVPTTARSGKGLQSLMQRAEEVSAGGSGKRAFKPNYAPEIEASISRLTQIINEKCRQDIVDPRWLSVRLIAKDAQACAMAKENLGYDFAGDFEIKEIVDDINNKQGNKNIKDAIVSGIVKQAEDIFLKTVTLESRDYNQKDRRLDKLLTSKYTGIPIMIILLIIIFWITISGANYPSELLSDLFVRLQDFIGAALINIGTPPVVKGLLVDGVLRVLSWVVAVMLPPMAIFFPLFTLLEDFGYLPRVAFNLDNYFKKANTCGKQALTMCMGFGCNAAGVTSCRIIDSPRERLIAIITNNFVPCNGRFPTLIAIISIFFTAGFFGFTQSLLSAVILMFAIIFSVLMTLLVSKVLSKTILKGIPSSFTLELPPYRRPQIGKVIVRSIFDRTLFVLGRAVVIAAPAGLIIWIFANVYIGNISVLKHFTDFLDPFAKLLGLDGVILTAFILGFPANEIVIPIILMSYMATGSITGYESLSSLHTLLINNGWTLTTAICFMLFCLMHWPCSTTCLTIKKETQSMKWTVISFLIPTLLGFLTCFIFNGAVKLFNLF